MTFWYLLLCLFGALTFMWPVLVLTLVLDSALTKSKGR